MNSPAEAIPTTQAVEQPVADTSPTASATEAREGGAMENDTPDTLAKLPTPFEPCKWYKGRELCVHAPYERDVDFAVDKYGRKIASFLDKRGTLVHKRRGPAGLWHMTREELEAYAAKRAAHIEETNAAEARMKADAPPDRATARALNARIEELERRIEQLEGRERRASASRLFFDNRKGARVIQAELEAAALVQNAQAPVWGGSSLYDVWTAIDRIADKLYALGNGAAGRESAAPVTVGDLPTGGSVSKNSPAALRDTAPVAKPDATSAVQSPTAPASMDLCEQDSPEGMAARIASVGDTANFFAASKSMQSSLPLKMIEEQYHLWRLAGRPETWTLPESPIPLPPLKKHASELPEHLFPPPKYRSLQSLCASTPCPLGEGQCIGMFCSLFVRGGVKYAPEKDRYAARAIEAEMICLAHDKPVIAGIVIDPKREMLASVADFPASYSESIAAMREKEKKRRERANAGNSPAGDDQEGGTA